MRLLTAIWLLLMLPALAQDNFIVSGIEFDGNESFTSSELQSYMSIYSRSWFSRSILRKDPFRFDQPSLDADIDRIRRFYQTEGFLNATVEADELEVDRKKRHVRVRVLINEGNVVRVDSVAFSLVAETDADRSRCDSLLSSIRYECMLVGGERFRDPDFHADKDMIIKKLADNGYPRARVEGKLTVKEAQNLVTCTWQISTGKLYRFGPAYVNGNVSYRDALVLSQIAFESGQLFEQELIGRSQKRIYALGLFHIVTLRALLDQSEYNRIPVEVTVREAPRWSTKLGVGYGNEELVRVFGDVQRLGFMGGARRLNLFAKHSALEPYRVDAAVTQPAFLDAFNTLTFNPFLSQQDEPAYHISRRGFNLNLQRRISTSLDGFVGYNFERIDGDSLNLVDEPGIYNKSGVTTALIRSTADPFLSPKRGSYGAIKVSYSGLGLGSEYHFLKLLGDARVYRTVSGNLVLASRIKVGTIFSYDDDSFIPFVERFYAGGSNSVRGWGRALLGPLDNENVPVGGSSLIEGNLELRLPIWSIVGGVLFFDGGNVWSDSNQFDTNDIRYAAGTGLRFETPIGPLRIDVATPVSDTDSQVLFHLSVGHAF